MSYRRCENCGWLYTRTSNDSVCSDCLRFDIEKVEPPVDGEEDTTFDG